MKKLSKLVKKAEKEKAEEAKKQIKSEGKGEEKKDESFSSRSKLSLSRLQKDYQEYEPIPSCTFEQKSSKDFYHYKLVIKPQEGIYEGGEYEFSMDCPDDYPNRPPKVMCLTTIYHPNIDLDGHVCLSILRVDKDWSPISTLNHVVCGLLSLFLEPNPDDPLNPEAGELMKKDFNEFTRIVDSTMRGGMFFGKQFKRMNGKK